MVRDAVSVLIDELTCGDDQRAAEAAHKLSAVGTQAVPYLRRLMESCDEDHRWWAARTLAEVESPETVPLLLQGLKDTDAGVRQAAALALRHHPDEQSLPALIAALDDPDHLVATLAGDALVALNGSAVPALIETLTNGSHGARLEAARALAHIGDTRAIPALFAALDESALIGFWARDGLERMGVGMDFFKPD